VNRLRTGCDKVADRAASSCKALSTALKNLVRRIKVRFSPATRIASAAARRETTFLELMPPQ